jgi:hypothetical protein
MCVMRKPGMNCYANLREVLRVTVTATLTAELCKSNHHGIADGVKLLSIHPRLLFCKVIKSWKTELGSVSQVELAFSTFKGSWTLQFRFKETRRITHRAEQLLCCQVSQEGSPSTKAFCRTQNQGSAKVTFLLTANGFHGLSKSEKSDGLNDKTKVILYLLKRTCGPSTADKLLWNEPCSGSLESGFNNRGQHCYWWQVVRKAWTGGTRYVGDDRTMTSQDGEAKPERNRGR